MDLHIVGGEPTPEERAAVDAVLGAPDSGWRGGARDVEEDGRASHGGRETWADRHRLLPALHGVQDRIGWISRGALNYICRRLTVPPAEAWGVLTFYHLLAAEPRPPIVAHVCDDIACRLSGAEEICAELEATLGSVVKGGSKAPPLQGLLDDRRGGSSDPPAIGWMRSPCLGQCDRAPAALVIAAGRQPIREEHTGLVNAAQLIRALDACRGSSTFDDASADGGRRGGGGADPPAASKPDLSMLGSLVPQAGSPDLRLLRRVGSVDPTSLGDYRVAGGYRALARAIELGPEGVLAEVVASGLLGRGGAAFPTGRKWDAVAREAARPRYVVCNADESEPGTFKDRVLMTGDPFTVIEALTICGFATGAEYGFIYIRGEYPLAEARIGQAIAAARDALLLGDNVAGAGFRFDLEIRRGGGAYICGEETALFNSIEGKRGEPRSKPPFPAQIGLFGRPTVVNNVETLANVPDILVEGGARWAQVGTKASTGTRLFCLCGHVAHPGLYEVPFGTTLRELLSLAGGVRGNRTIRGVLLGGAAGVFVGPDEIDLRLTFEDVKAAGATLGSGVIMVFDETTDFMDTLRRMAEFFEDESCGQCVPCRVGTVRQRELLERLSAGNAARAGETVQSGRSSDGPTAPDSPALEEQLVVLAELGQAMRDASICGLGQTASSAIESAVARLNMFRHGDRA